MRLHERWNEKRKQIAKGDIVDGLRPSWLDFDKRTRTFSPNRGAAAVRWIFERTADGIGQRQIVRVLQRDFPPIGRSKKWNTKFCPEGSQRSVGSRRASVLRVHRGGARVPVATPVPGYYPSVIDDPLWFRGAGEKAGQHEEKGSEQPVRQPLHGGSLRTSLTGRRCRSKPPGCRGRRSNVG